jgi:predicted nuclease of predicted toxin-antitoxin system
VKFLIDMPLSPDLAEWLRSAGHDAIHVSKRSMHLSSDSEILQVASHEGRVVITADLDFPRLLAQLGTPGPGLILLRGGNYSETESLARVQRVLRAIKETDLPRAVIVVDREKIRRRWLPI